MKRLITLSLLIISIASFGQSVPLYNYISASGTDTYTATMLPTPTYTSGLKFTVKFANDNTGASTINLNTLGAKDIKIGSSALSAGEIDADKIYWLIYDGTQFQMSGGGGGTSLTFSSPLSESLGVVSIANAAADGSTKGAASFTAADFDASSGNISVDYTNGQASSGSTKGFLSSTDWTTFNNKVPTSRTISTTAPLAGGGDLSGNLTLSIPNAAADGSTKGAASFTANDFDASSGNIGIDYTNGQAASGSLKGFLTVADWTTFNGKQSAITFGTGVQTALGVNIGSAGAPILFNGAGGTPSSMTATNLSGTAASLNSGTAATLTTSRNINQVSFNGSANIKLNARSSKTANYSVVSTDAMTTIMANPSADITFTIDQLTADDWILVKNKGTFNVLFAAGSGVTLTGLTTLGPGYDALIYFDTSTSTQITGGGVATNGVSVVYKSMTTTGVSGAGETTLFTYTLPAGTLGTNGESILIQSAGTYATSVNSKTIKFKFGGTTVSTGALAVTTTAPWWLEATVIRVDATNQKVILALITGSSTQLAEAVYSTATETLSGTVTISITGQGGATNDVVGEFVKMKKEGF